MVIQELIDVWISLKLLERVGTLVYLYTSSSQRQRLGHRSAWIGFKYRR